MAATITGRPLVLVKKLGIGSVDITGRNATAVMVGRLCNRRKPVQCIVNGNPNSRDELFTVHLKRIGRTWYIAFRE